MASLMRPRPRILHLFSDWKWTGPAEPIVNLCRHLRRHGHTVDLACQRPEGAYVDSLVHRAVRRRVEPIQDFHLRKGFHLLDTWEDVRNLTAFIDREEVNIVHVHTRHDHYVGSRAARRANNRPFVVRTSHAGAPVPGTLVNRWLMRGHTDAWVALSENCAREDARTFGIAPEHALAVEGAVDLERFNPQHTYADVRRELGLTERHVLAGIVARVQRHRRFQVLLPALAEAMRQEPSLRAMIVGRGTYFNELVRDPARQMGLEDKVFLPGYLSDNYCDYLAALDFKIFLVPGSDGSCRAAREAMALGKPVLAARRGILPELVEDGKCGLVIDDTVENLTAAILRLARDADLRRRLGRNAAAKAQARFGLETQVNLIADLYMRLAEGR